MNEKERLPGRRLGEPGTKDPFERGVACFNAGEFFEAHEVWEEIWLRAPDAEKPFLQGVIQIAAAFHHYRRGNFIGARSLLAAGIAKMKPFPGGHREIDKERLVREAQAFLESLDQSDSGSLCLPRICVRK